jgi:transglutaminase-like putative cysteine protease
VILALSLRTFHARVGNTRKHGYLRRGVAIGVALLIGFVSSSVVNSWGDEITRWYVSAFVKAQHNERIGLSSTPQLTAMFNPAPSPQRVMIIQGALSDPHLRAMAFDDYAHGTWRGGLTGNSFSRMWGQELCGDAVGRRVHVHRLPDELNLLYVPLACAGVSTSDDIPVDRDDFGALHVPDNDHDTIEYDVILASERDHQGPVTRAPSAAQRASALAMPSDMNADVRALAQRLTQNLAPRDRIDAVERYLQTNNAYSLKTDPGDAVDPVARFIVEKRAGHCQYFASAAVMLLRSAGVPARYVNGFYAHETSGDTTIVRQRDAHAWCEAWVDGVGWTTVDATPGSGRPDQVFPKLPWWRRTREKLEDAWAAARTWVGQLGWTRVLAMVGAGTVVVAGAQAMRQWVKSRGPKRVAPAYAGVDVQLLDLGRRFERMLRARGEKCEPERTWREHLDALDARGNDGVDVEGLRRFVGRYNDARFGNRDMTEVGELRGLMDELDRSVKTAGH